MPLTHDMGLIGFHLTPLLNGTTHYLMRAASFVRRPLLWLDAAARLGATIISSPNFGLKHFLDRFGQTAAQPRSCDLSHIRLIFNGAEPISAELCRRFIAALAPQGLRPTTMFPVYGLAEASLAVTFPPPGRELRTIVIDADHTGIGDSIRIRPQGLAGGVELVGLGTGVAGCTVRIVGETDETLPERTVGRILIKGANVTSGYFRDPAATRDGLRRDGWLDTGDIGFFCEGDLYVTGRVKDLIFVRGQNHYAQDIERVAREIGGLESAGMAAVGLLDPATQEHEVVLFVASHPAPATDFRQIREEVIRHVNLVLGVRLSDVLTIDRIPRTTSGKIQRFMLAEYYRHSRI
jgi:acyl-CoA synthetase (AMP-forming)/AMP-acid ligase II